MQLSNDLAALIGFACEAVLWGINATLFLVSLVILRQRPLSDNLNNPILYLNGLIFLCCTTHFALEFNHFHTTLNAIGVTNYANETSQLVGADFLISLTDLLGDFVLIYRCWMLWGKNYYIVILPLLTSIGGFACIIATIDILLATNPTSPTPPAALIPLGLASYSLPLCTNVVVTSLIVYRIWYTSRALPDSPLEVGQGATRRAIILIIESGALYLLFQLIFVVLVSIPNPAEAILAVMAVQIYGIAPTLIIIRVGLGISSENTSEAVASTRIKWVARRGEDMGTSATNYTDGLVTSTDLEETKESDLSRSGKHDHDMAEFSVFKFAPTRRSEGTPSPV